MRNYEDETDCEKWEKGDISCWKLATENIQAVVYNFEEGHKYTILHFVKLIEG